MAARGRRRTSSWDDEAEPVAQPASACWLCARPLGTRVEWHHATPKSRGGRDTVPVHPICHRTIHATFTNAELARLAVDGDAPAGQPALQVFLAWIAGKPPDFNAPTRRRK